MKITKQLKKIIPTGIKRYYWRYLKRQEKLRKRRIKFDGKTPKEAFTFIYNTNYWSGKESISGGGSDLTHTRNIIKGIGNLIHDMQFKTVIDIPCGDFIWMQYVDFAEAQYIGGDIVEDLIHKNAENHQFKKQIKFEVIDLIEDRLPKGDILINRDCLVHLSFNDIFKVLKNIKKSECRYLLTTTFPNTLENKDITTGEWRPLNLELPPFNFLEPKLAIDEQFKHPLYGDKSLALWHVEDIPVLDVEPKR